MKKIFLIFFALILALIISVPAQSSTFKKNIIEGVKFLDSISEVEWYKVEGKSLIIGWKGIPKFFPHHNRKAAVRANIATSQEVRVWAVRHTQKSWHVGSGKSYICFVSANNGRIKNGTCNR